MSGTNPMEGECVPQAGARTRVQLCRPSSSRSGGHGCWDTLSCAFLSARANICCIAFDLEAHAGSAHGFAMDMGGFPVVPESTPYSLRTQTSPNSKSRDG